MSRLVERDDARFFGFALTVVSVVAFQEARTEHVRAAGACDMQPCSNRASSLLEILARG